MRAEIDTLFEHLKVALYGAIGVIEEGEKSLEEVVIRNRISELEF